MIEQQITLCSNGRAVLSGYSGGLLLGYAHNTGVYRCGSSAPASGTAPPLWRSGICPVRPSR